MGKEILLVKNIKKIKADFKKSPMISKSEKFKAKGAENAESKQCAKDKRFAFTGWRLFARSPDNS